MNRYDIKAEGLGEINIDLSENGDWVRFDDIRHLISGTKKTEHNSDYAKCCQASKWFKDHNLNVIVCPVCGNTIE